MVLSSTRKDDANTKAKLQYCAYVELTRPIFREDQSFAGGEFRVLPHYSQTGVIPRKILQVKISTKLQNDKAFFMSLYMGRSCKFVKDLQIYI
jgi:hypothetical protein